MRLGDLLGFRKDLYFDGAVQIDWFYDHERSAKVAENFVFHGKNYFGVEDGVLGSKNMIDTISLVKELTAKLKDDTVSVPSLAIADYGTGKSHLAVTLGQLFSGPEYMPETFQKVLRNIRQIDEADADAIEANCDGSNFVMVINGMRDFNLNSEILRSAQRSLRLYGLPDDNLRKLNRAVETATLFFERNCDNFLSLFEQIAEEHDWDEKGDELKKKINDELISNDEAFDIVNRAYKEVNGQEIRWDEGLSAASILEMLISEYCGINGKFDHVIILFDEFGRYLEYASAVNAAKSGDSALQQIFETIQNSDGALQVINFIQSDIKTYLQRVDQTKNISRYIGRYDGSDKYYISSNLETVFANLIQRKDKDAFRDSIIRSQEEHEDIWKDCFEKINKWLIPRGLWKEYNLFRKVIVEGIYPMHPLSTFMLTQLSDYLQNRSSLTLISNYIEELSDTEVGDELILVMPEYLMRGDLYVEMLAAEQDGKQASQHCIRYDNILKKYGDKLSSKSLMVLRSNLILRILRFRTTDYDDVKEALSFVSGLSLDDINGELVWLENEYALLGYDEHAGCFDFMEESNGAHDFKVLKKRLITAASLPESYIKEIKIREIASLFDAQSTNYGNAHKISTNEWIFRQELLLAEEFNEEVADSYVEDWKSATSSVAPKGRLVWLYINKETESDLVDRIEALVKKFIGLPIVVMLINDVENRLHDCLTEYFVFDTMDDSTRMRYERHYADGFKAAENNLKDEFEELKKQRLQVTEDGVRSVGVRMATFLTDVFEEIYPKSVPFWFDSFVTKGNNLSGKGGTYFCSIIKMLLSGSVNSNSIHNFASDVRNRIDAVLMTSSGTSWKCINEECRIIPPENIAVRSIYDEIVNELNESAKKACSEIFDKYCMPPYGLSEDIVTLMIAVICANLSYCLRFEYDGSVTNISIWKENVVIKDKKIDVSVIKKSTIIMVDAGEVVGKYKRLFLRIQDNRSITAVEELSRSLEKLRMVDEVPEEIETEYMLTKNILDKGISAHKEWLEILGEIEEKYDNAYEDGDFYNGLKALEQLRGIQISKYFADNGFDFDDDSRRSLKTLENQIVDFIKQNIDVYISQMYCKDLEHLTTFRNHNTKIQTMLENLGFPEYAARVGKQKEKELENIEEIKSRQELRGDYDKFMEDSKIGRFTTYVTIREFVKRGEKLQERVQRFRSSLGKDKVTIETNLNGRMSELKAAKDRIEGDITDIWDDLGAVESIEDVESLIERISLVLQKGISPNDQRDLEETKSNLDGLLIDLRKLASADTSRKKFAEASQELAEKYESSEFDFNVMDIIDSVKGETLHKLEAREHNWIKENLTLGDGSRASVHRWKEKIRILPEYLSEHALADVRKLDNKADDLIKEGKIEDVIFYFEKLSFSEKEECLQKLQGLMTS